MSEDASRLPAGWAEVSFDDAIVVVSDRGQRIKQKNYLEDGALAVVDQGEGLVGGYTDDVSAQVEHVPPVILFGDHTRRFKYVTFPFAVGADGVKLFAPTDLHDPEFLFYQLGTIDLENRGYGRHYQYLRKETLRIPPKSEQTRIVEKLEGLLSDLDAGVAELKAAQRKLAQYRQSLLKAAVEGALTADWRAARAQTAEPQESGAELLQRILTERRARWETRQLARFAEQGKTPPKGWQAKYTEPVAPDADDLPTLPEGWVWASLDQLADSVKNGLSQKPNTDCMGYPILRINAVRTMSVRLDEVRHLDLPDDEASPYVLDEGDLLATRYNGSIDLLGVVGVVRGLTQPTLHPDKLIRIKPVLCALLADWIEICASTGSSRKHVVSRVKTTAGQTGISGTDIKKMPIPLASLLEQVSCVESVRVAIVGIEDQDRNIEHALRQSAAQRKNILKAAFTGQLVPQDPNDEPASVLLERIRAERDNPKLASTRSRRTKQPKSPVEPDA